MSVMAKRLDGSRCHLAEVDLGPGDIVLDGDPAPQKGHSPPVFGPRWLWPNVGYIRIPLGTEVGFGSSDIVLDGDLATP